MNDEMAFDEKSVDEMAFGEKYFDKMTFDELVWNGAIKTEHTNQF
jgi:hypothetical protein